MYHRRGRDEVLAKDRSVPAPDADAAARIEAQLTILLRLMSASHRRRNYPMERSHYLLLGAIEDGEKCAGEIAERLGLDQSTVVRQINAVERAGFAQRSTHPRDRRSVLIRMTPAGAAAMARMRALRHAGIEALTADWTVEERAQLCAMLTRFNTALVLRDAKAGAPGAQRAARAEPARPAADRPRRTPKTTG